MARKRFRRGDDLSWNSEAGAGGSSASAETLASKRAGDLRSRLTFLHRPIQLRLGQSQVTAADMRNALNE